MKIITLDGSVGDVSGERIDDMIFATFERSRSDGTLYIGEEIHLIAEVSILPDLHLLKRTQTS